MSAFFMAVAKPVLLPPKSAFVICIRDLQKGGIDMKKMSIIGQDYHTDEHVVGYYNAGDP